MGALGLGDMFARFDHVALITQFYCVWLSMSHVPYGSAGVKLRIP